MSLCTSFVSVLFWKIDHIWKRYFKQIKMAGREGGQCVSQFGVAHHKKEGNLEAQKTN